MSILVLQTLQSNLEVHFFFSITVYEVFLEFHPRIVYISYRGRVLVISTIYY